MVCIVVIRGEESNLGKHVAIEGCRALDNGADGFSLSWMSLTSLMRSHAIRNQRHGVHLEAAIRIILRNIVIWESGNCGINVAPHEHRKPLPRLIHARNTRIFNAKSAGVCLLDASEVCLEYTTVQNTFGKKSARIDKDIFSSVEDVKGVCRFTRLP